MLESICAEMFTSLIRNWKYAFLVENNYIETNIQKGFRSGVSGTL